VIDVDQLAVVLGLEALGQLGRADQVTEHRGDLPPLAERRLPGRISRVIRRSARIDLAAALRAKARREREPLSAAGALAAQRAATGVAEARASSTLVSAARALHGLLLRDPETRLGEHDTPNP
jgi:hypothetical protein